MSEPRRFKPPRSERVWYQSPENPNDLVVYDGERYRWQNDPEKPVDFNEKEFREVSRLADRGCKFGDYPWDHWKKWAVEDGVDEDLAQLGRLLIREADQHGWSLELKQECGWDDHGAEMLRLARTEPEKTRERWQYLLNTDGEKVSPQP